MTAKSIMTTDLITLTPDVSVAEALHMMSKHCIHNVPVVDKEGAFVGLFSLRWVAHEMLPTASHLGNETFHFDMGFVSDESDEFLQRLQEIGRRPVGDMLEKKKKLRFCEPDTTIPKLLQLLSENPVSLPVLVVEGKKKKVVGMVSNWDVLTKIAEALLVENEQRVPEDETAATEDT